jgi:hypothetical protein
LIEGFYSNPALRGPCYSSCPEQLATMSTANNYKLEVWKGGWNLLSVDPECLRAIVRISATTKYNRCTFPSLFLQTFVCLSKAPVTVVLNSTPWIVPGGIYPVLTGIDLVGSVNGAENIVKFLKSQVG